MTLVNGQCDTVQTKWHLKLLAKNIWSNEWPFQSCVFCRVISALNSSTKRLKTIQISVTEGFTKVTSKQGSGLLCFTYAWSTCSLYDPMKTNSRNWNVRVFDAFLQQTVGILFTEPLTTCKYKKKNKTINTHICIILHQIKKHNIFSLQSHSCMQRESCFWFEHPE